MMRRLVSWLPSVTCIGFIAAIRWEGLSTLTANVAATLLAAVAAAVVVGRGRAASPVDRGLAGFLALGTAGLWIGPLRSVVVAEAGALLYATLCAVALVPLLLGREPFTTHFARRTTPEVLWATPVFQRINREMSAGWAGLFACAAAVSLAPRLFPGVLGGAPWQWAVRDLLPALLLVTAGISLNRLYPAWRQRIFGRATAPAPTPLAPSTRGNYEVRPAGTGPTVVVLNGSPHGAVGNTSRMIAMLRTHLEAAGFRLEEIFLGDKDISYCTGCGFCLENRGCWRRDDHAGVVRKLLDADAVILASPVYFLGVTAQTKTFIDRCLPYGHRPRATWKPGLAVSVSGGLGETDTARYLEGALRTFGAYSVGALTAIAVTPGQFFGQDAVAARAEDLAADLVRAVREGRRHPPTDQDLRFWHFMGALVRENREFMAGDHRHWEGAGLYESFERYAQQRWSAPDMDPEVRAQWVRSLMESQQRGEPESRPAGSGGSRPAFATCRELLAAMPASFRPGAAGGLEAVYQFEVPDEDLVAHLRVADGTCTYVEEPAEAPDVVIETPGSVWLAVSRGEIDGQQAFLSGKYRVQGDLARLMRMSEIFAEAA